MDVVDQNMELCSILIVMCSKGYIVDSHYKNLLFRFCDDVDVVEQNMELGSIMIAR